MRVLRRIRPCSSGCWGRWTGQAVSTERLCALLWDDNPPDQARRAVQAHVSRIRGPLGDVLLPKGDGYLLRVPAEAVGASRFRALVDQARAADDLTERDRLLGAALAFWRGTALKDAAGERLRQRLCGELEELRLHATEESLAARLALGRHAELIPELARLSAEHPTRDSTPSWLGRLRCTGHTSTPAGSRTGSSTSTCAASIPVGRRPTRYCSTALLPLDSARGLTRHVQDDAVDFRYLVGDAGRDAGDHVVGQARPVRRHGVVA